MGDTDGAAKSKRQRARTMSRKEMARERRRALARGETFEVVNYDRPRTRDECRTGVRPCLFVSCRHHLYLDVNPITGSVKLNFPDKEVWELEETCALDVADRGGITLEEVGVIMNLTRERIRQVEVLGLSKLKDMPEDDGGLEAFEGWDPRRDD
ncbi:MAG: sigma factor-like helix-turn-helix DNA-binding protein [Pseudomonadota bacterium]